MALPPPDKQEVPLSVYIVIMEKGNMPCIEIRKRTTNIDIIKTIISCAFHGRPIILMPTFSDKMRALSSLIQKGIIYKDKKSGEYCFTI